MTVSSWGVLTLLGDGLSVGLQAGDADGDGLGGALSALLERWYGYSMTRAELHDLIEALPEDRIEVAAWVMRLTPEQWRELEGLLETAHILADQEFMSGLRDSIAQADQGQTIDLDEARRRLGV
jgi:hypothetical protein